MKLRLRLVAAAGATLALAGCAAGPSYRAPVAPTAAAQPFVSADPRIAAADATRADWWRLYDLPALDGLVQAALVNNTDLRVAAANIAEARASLSGARSNLLPTPVVSGSAQYSQARANPLFNNPPEGWTYTGGLDVSYEADLFGRIRRGIQAAIADVEAREAAQDTVRVTVAAETTRAYLNACGYAQQAEVARRSLDLLGQSYDITARRRDLGASSDYEVSLSAGLREQARAQIPLLEAQRRSALYQLAVLTGRLPAEISQDAAACLKLPSLTAPVPVGDGAALLRRRPDVRNAERTLAASVARIGVATADLYPTVSLGASVSEAATKRRGLQSGPADPLDHPKHHRRPGPHPRRRGAVAGVVGQFRRLRAAGVEGGRAGAVALCRRARPQRRPDHRAGSERRSPAVGRHPLRGRLHQLPEPDRRPARAGHRR